MIRSMTAYASRSGAVAGAHWLWEMRGVNSRGLDVRLRLPDGVPGLDAKLREACKAALSRGNVTISLRLTTEDAAQALTVDPAQLDRVLTALDQVQERAFEMGVTLGQPTAADVLATRGVVQSGGNEADMAGIIAALLEDIAPLLSEFVAMRASEGAALATVITAQLDEIETLVGKAADAAAARKPEVQRALQEALQRVMTEVSEADETRVAQELALLAVKQDVTEELDRLTAHVAAARDLLAAEKPMGRKLDFLAQEFNREANTLCAKSQNTALTAHGLDLKAVIDQMREQIQNVE